MAHSLSPNLRLDDLHAALFTDNPSMLHPFVFAAIAFIVLGGAENFGTEEPILLGFESSVVDGLRLLHLSMGPRFDLLRRGNGDANGIIVDRIFGLLKK
jgi:hypothetical protein